MKILILGGTGAIGKELVNELSQYNKYDIYITSRKKHTSTSNIHYICGNALDQTFIKKIVTDDHYDAIVDFMVYKSEEFSNRVELFLENTTQYIFLSSARVYGNEDKLINEETKRLLDVCKDKDYIFKEEYALDKAKEENCLINNSKNNWTIIRPYITYNNNRIQFGVYEKEEWLYRVLKNKKIVIPSELLEKYTTLTYAQNVSKYLAKLILNPKAYGQIYQITNNKSVKWKDVFELYKKVLTENGYNVNYIIANSKMDYKLPINKYQLFYDRYYNRRFYSDKLSDCIHEKVEYDDINKLAICLEDFLKNYDINKIELEPRFTGLMDKQTKEKTSLKEFKCIKNKIKYILARYTFYYSLRK